MDSSQERAFSTESTRSRPNEGAESRTAKGSFNPGATPLAVDATVRVALARS